MKKLLFLIILSLFTIASLAASDNTAIFATTLGFGDLSVIRTNSFEGYRGFSGEFLACFEIAESGIGIGFDFGFQMALSGYDESGDRNYGLLFPTSGGAMGSFYFSAGPSFILDLTDDTFQLILMPFLRADVMMGKDGAAQGQRASLQGGMDIALYKEIFMGFGVCLSASYSRSLYEFIDDDWFAEASQYWRVGIGITIPLFLDTGSIIGM